MEKEVYQALKHKGNNDGAKMITHGVSEQGHFYIIMEKYGLSLKEMLRHAKTQRFSLKTAVQIGIQLIDRLKELHECGFIHNDLKPDNILLGSD